MTTAYCSQGEFQPGDWGARGLLSVGSVHCWWTALGFLAAFCLLGGTAGVFAQRRRQYILGVLPSGTPRSFSWPFPLSFLVCSVTRVAPSESDPCPDPQQLADDQGWSTFCGPYGITNLKTNLLYTVALRRLRHVTVGLLAGRLHLPQEWISALPACCWTSSGAPDLLLQGLMAGQF